MTLFEASFEDSCGVTHEKTSPIKPVIGHVSLCGRRFNTTIIENKIPAIHIPTVLRVLVQRSPPNDVNCMSCLIARTKLDRLDFHESWWSTAILLELRIKSWQ